MKGQTRGTLLCFADGSNVRPIFDQLVEESLGLLQIERVEAFGEPAIDRTEKIASLLPFSPVAPEPRHAPCRRDRLAVFMARAVCLSAPFGLTVRTAMVELAWLWTRYQLGAAQVCWFRERVGLIGRRVRKIMIVAAATPFGLAPRLGDSPS